MSQMFRTTLRLDLDKPASAQAAALLRQLHAERGLSYSALIVPAVNAYYGKAPADESLRETIRSIVQEELAAAPVQLAVHSYACVLSSCAQLLVVTRLLSMLFRIVRNGFTQFRIVIRRGFEPAPEIGLPAVNVAVLALAPHKLMGIV